MEDITIRFLDGFSEDEVKSPILIEGLPGIGHVGKLVAEHIIHELGAKKIAQIHSIYFPPQVIIGEDSVIRLANNEIFFYKDESHEILFLVGDFQSTSNEGHYLLAGQYLEIAEKLGCPPDLHPWGIRGRPPRGRAPCAGAVNRAELKEEAAEAGAVFDNGEPAGGIIGAAGLLLGLSAHHNIEGICLMGETSGYLVDPKSATNLLKVLSSLIDIDIDATTLVERGVEMERMVQKLIEGEQSIHDEELRYIV